MAGQKLREGERDRATGQCALIQYLREALISVKVFLPDLVLKWHKTDRDLPISDLLLMPQAI